MNNTEIFYKHMLKLIQSGKVPMELRRNAYFAEKFDIDRYALNLLLQMNYVKNNPDAKKIFNAEYIGEYIKTGGLEKPVMGSILIQEFNPITYKRLSSAILTEDVFKTLYPTQSKNNPNVYVPAKTMLLGARVPNQVVSSAGVLLEDIPAQKGSSKVVFPGDIMFFPYNPNKSISSQVDEYAFYGANHDAWGIEPPKWQPCYEDGEFKDFKLNEFYSKMDSCME